MVQEHKGTRAQGYKNAGIHMPFRRGLSVWFTFMFILVVWSSFCDAQEAGAVSAAEGLPIVSIETQGNVTISAAKILATVRARADGRGVGRPERVPGCNAYLV